MFYGSALLAIGLILVFNSQVPGQMIINAIGWVLVFIGLIIGTYFEREHSRKAKDYENKIKHLESEINMINKTLRWYENDEK